MFVHPSIHLFIHSATLIKFLLCVRCCSNSYGDIKMYKTRTLIQSNIQQFLNTYYVPCTVLRVKDSTIKGVAHFKDNTTIIIINKNNIMATTTKSGPHCLQHLFTEVFQACLLEQAFSQSLSSQLLICSSTYSNTIFNSTLHGNSSKFLMD